MTGRVVSSALAAIGSLAWSVTVAQAGGGQGASSFNTFFECQGINGSNVNRTVGSFGIVPDPPTGDPEEGAVIHGNLKVGNAVLVCRQVDVKEGTVFLNGPISSTDLKCYAVTTPGKQPPATVETQTDGFFLQGETVTVYQATHLLCGPVVRITE